MSPGESWVSIVKGLLEISHLRVEITAHVNFYFGKFSRLFGIGVAIWEVHGVYLPHFESLLPDGNIILPGICIKRQYPNVHEGGINNSNYFLCFRIPSNLQWDNSLLCKDSDYETITDTHFEELHAELIALFCNAKMWQRVARDIPQNSHCCSLDTLNASRDILIEESLSNELTNTGCKMLMMCMTESYVTKEQLRTVTKKIVSRLKAPDRKLGSSKGKKKKRKSDRIVHDVEVLMSMAKSALNIAFPARNSLWSLTVFEASEERGV